MSYKVREVSLYHADATHKVYQVFNPKMDTKESWVFDAYLMGVKASENVIDDFWNKLNDKFGNDVIFERDALIDSKRKCYTGISVINVLFQDINKAKEYASLLEKALSGLDK